MFFMKSPVHKKKSTLKNQNQKVFYWCIIVIIEGTNINISYQEADQELY